MPKKDRTAYNIWGEKVEDDDDQVSYSSSFDSSDSDAFTYSTEDYMESSEPTTGDYETYGRYVPKRWDDPQVFQRRLERARENMKEQRRKDYQEQKKKRQSSQTSSSSKSKTKTKTTIKNEKKKKPTPKKQTATKTKPKAKKETAKKKETKKKTSKKETNNKKKTVQAKKKKS